MNSGLNRSLIPVNILRDPRGIYGRSRARGGTGLFFSLEHNEKHM